MAHEFYTTSLTDFLFIILDIFVIGPHVLQSNVYMKKKTLYMCIEQEMCGHLTERRQRPSSSSPSSILSHLEWNGPSFAHFLPPSGNSFHKMPYQRTRSNGN